jgi:hypothetical protein
MLLVPPNEQKVTDAVANLIWPNCAKVLGIHPRGPEDLSIEFYFEDGSSRLISAEILHDVMSNFRG